MISTPDLDHLFVGDGYVGIMRGGLCGYVVVVCGWVYCIEVFVFV